MNVVIIPSIPANDIRLALYRMLGFKIGNNSFIGMRCYMDDRDPSMTVIGDNVIISYGVYFAAHGKRQSSTSIHICSGVYIGMGAMIVSGKNGITIGEGAVIGAGAVVNKSVPPGCTAVGVPIRIIPPAKCNHDDEGTIPSDGD